MSSELLPAIIFLFLFLLLVGIAHALYKLLRVQTDLSRKFLHISGGILSLFLPFFISSPWTVLIMCAIAFLILTYTYMKKLLPAVHQTRRNSVGSILFPIPICLCFLAANKTGLGLLFYLPLSILIVSDTAAEWGGKKWGSYTLSFFNNQKTIAGSLSFAVTAFILSLIWMSSISQRPVIEVLKIAFLLTLVTTLIELISLKGLDNLTVPLSAVVILYLLLYMD